MRFHASAACIGSALIVSCLAGDRQVSSHVALKSDDMQGADGAAFFQASLRRTAALPVELAHDVRQAVSEVVSEVPEDDSLSSSPALLAYMVGKASHKLVLIASDTHVGASLASYFQQHWLTIVFGFIVLFTGLLLLWFNELRSVKMDALLVRGINECESIDADKVDDDTRGLLVHAVGETIGTTPVQDPQFQGAVVHSCLKLQSNVEVYEWVQTVKIGQSGRPGQRPGQLEDKRSQVGYHFQKEWSTVHRNSLQFQRSAGKPSPDNPRPPRGLNLGTFTSVCKHIKLGGFTLPDDMCEQFRSFEVAPMHLLPPTLQACGVSFYANKDGYFYSRPSNKSMWGSGRLGPSFEPVVGDLRVRFLYVPQGVATVVAVHCEKDGIDTFVPYRAIPRGCCSNEGQDRQRLIEEGTRSLEEMKANDDDMTPCMETKHMSISCFCCPCSTISRCTKEVVTEEIYYVSETQDPISKPFDWVVPRSSLRVWFFRGLGWLACYIATLSVLNTLTSQTHKVTAFKAYGSWAAAVLAAIIATSASTLVIAIACVCYSPAQSLKWVFAMAVVIAIPFVVGWAEEDVH